MHLYNNPIINRIGPTSTNGPNVLLPTEIEDHPAPFFKSPPVDFGKIDDMPWKTAQVKKMDSGTREKIINFWMEDFINDTLQEELTTASVWALEDNMNKVL
jgi:hypothetical protein